MSEIMTDDELRALATRATEEAARLQQVQQVVALLARARAHQDTASRLQAGGDTELAALDLEARAVVLKRLVVLARRAGLVVAGPVRCVVPGCDRLRAPGISACRECKEEADDVGRREASGIVVMDEKEGAPRLALPPDMLSTTGGQVVRAHVVVEPGRKAHLEECVTSPGVYVCGERGCMEEARLDGWCLKHAAQHCKHPEHPSEKCRHR